MVTYKFPITNLGFIKTYTKTYYINIKVIKKPN
jgi:hypothetical protein